MIPSVTGLTAVMGILKNKGYRDLRTSCNNNADGIDRLQGRPDHDIADARKKVTENGLHVKMVRHQVANSDLRINKMEDTTKTLQDMYILCHNIAKEAYTALQSLPRHRHVAPPLTRAACGRTQPVIHGPLDFGNGALH